MRKWLSGRASPCQGEGREFESRLPLHLEALLSSMDKRAFLLYGFKRANDKAADGGHGGVSDIANRRIKNAGWYSFCVLARVHAAEKSWRCHGCSDRRLVRKILLYRKF